jgi:hypothetical protein
VNKAQITAELVSCLMRQHFPELTGRRIAAVDVDGSDNSTFRVGETHVARLPTDGGYVPAVAKEHKWLPVIAPQLPVRLPEPVSVRRPGCGFPDRGRCTRGCPASPRPVIACRTRNDSRATLRLSSWRSNVPTRATPSTSEDDALPITSDSPLMARGAAARWLRQAGREASPYLSRFPVVL